MEPERKKKETFTSPPPRSTSTSTAAKKSKESFTYYDPAAENVLVVGDFTDWDHNPIALKKQKDGTWKATIPLDPGEHEYRFLVDGRWQDDSQCSARKPNGFGQQNCVRYVK
jgi:1,4-alpha-glucan branching enzyme